MRISLATIFLLIGSMCMAQSTHPGWVVQPRLTTGNLYDVQFASRENGWIVGSQTILKTTNAGASWQMKEYPQSWFDNIVILHGMSGWLMAASNPSTGSSYVVRLDGESEMWLADTSLIAGQPLDALYFLNEDYGWTVGVGSEHKAVLYRTQNGGKSWDEIATGLDEVIRDVFFVDGKTGWMVGQNGGFYESTDGGLNWNFVHQALYTHDPNYAPQGYPVRRIVFKTPDDGWAIGGISGVEVRSRTTDGGQTWIESTFSGGSSLQGMYFLDAINGWAVGGANAGTKILHTSDAGQSWIQQGHDINSNGVPVNNTVLNGIFMTGAAEGWIVGKYGTVLKTTSGGMVTAIEDVEMSVPLDFELGQNYPNPFNPSTTIEFSLARESFVELTVTNTLGKKVATLVHGTHPAGRHAVHFEAVDLPSGVYFYTLRSGGIAITKRLMLMK